MLPLIDTEARLEDVLSEPTPEVCDAVSRLDGDLMLLGVGGKMGPTLAKLAKRAADRAGVAKRIIGVARFSSAGLARELTDAGIETVACDLLADGAFGRLPDAPNVIYLVGMKFGTTGQEPLTWAMNALLPASAADRFRNSRIVALSTGNVYPLTPPSSGGPTEDHPTDPIGEYAQSCLGRERMFQYFSEKHGTPATLIRLNYAIDLRYGVLLDVATKVYKRVPIDLSMGYANVIWQRDANAIVLRAFSACASPPTVLNVTGPGTVAIRDLAHKFGQALGIEPVLVGTEKDTALLSNASKCTKLFGPPPVTLEQMIEWITHWVKIGGRTLNKPTHFEQRDGKF